MNKLRIKKRLVKEHYSVDACSDGEEAMEYINEDELLEVTPKSIRVRKKTLDTETRLKRKAKGLE